MYEIHLGGWEVIGSRPSATRYSHYAAKQPVRSRSHHPSQRHTYATFSFSWAYPFLLFFILIVLVYSQVTN